MMLLTQTSADQCMCQVLRQCKWSAAAYHQSNHSIDSICLTVATLLKGEKMSGLIFVSRITEYGSSVSI